MVSTLPSCEWCFSGRSQTSDKGRCFENMATPEQPAEFLQKFQYAWQPGIQILPLSQAASSIFVQFMQMMSGFEAARYFGNSYFAITDLMPLTFHEDINNLLGVLPVPNYHLLILVFTSPKAWTSSVLNFLDLLLTTLSAYYYTFYLEKSFTCTYFLDYGSATVFFFGGITQILMYKYFRHKIAKILI